MSSSRDGDGKGLSGMGRRCLCLLALLAILQACGYRPLEGGVGPQGAQQLHMAGITNDTFNPGIQAAVSAAIVRQLRFNTRIRLTDETAADLILSGRVTSYQSEAVAFNVQDIGRRYRVRVILLATLAGRGGGQVRLTQEVSGQAFYTTGSTAADTRAAEQEAALRAAQDLAIQLMALLVEEL